MVVVTEHAPRAHEDAAGLIDERGVIGRHHGSVTPSRSSCR
jgi:hypothetical protein